MERRKGTISQSQIAEIEAQIVHCLLGDIEIINRLLSDDELHGKKENTSIRISIDGNNNIVFNSSTNNNINGLPFNDKD